MCTYIQTYLLCTYIYINSFNINLHSPQGCVYACVCVCVCSRSVRTEEKNEQGFSMSSVCLMFLPPLQCPPLPSPLSQPFGSSVSLPPVSAAMSLHLVACVLALVSLSAASPSDCSDLVRPLILEDHSKVNPAAPVLHGRKAPCGDLILTRKQILLQDFMTVFDVIY